MSDDTKRRPRPKTSETKAISFAEQKVLISRVRFFDDVIFNGKATIHVDNEGRIYAEASFKS